MIDRLQLFLDKIEIDESTGCWIWTASRTADGYGQFWDNGKCIRAHIWSYKYFYDQEIVEINICHNCPGGDNPLCVNPEHLWLGTQSDNISDMYHKGRGRDIKGERHHNSKLTECDVINILELSREGLLPTEIAPIYGVWPHTIRYILSGRTWSHITKINAVPPLHSLST